MLLGHSYGGYLARRVTAQRPEMVRGLALLCPVAERSGSVPAHARGGSPGRRRVRRTATCAAGGVAGRGSRTWNAPRSVEPGPLAGSRDAGRSSQPRSIHAEETR